LRLRIQRDAPKGGHETLSFVQIWPPSVTMYAAFPTNSSEVGGVKGIADSNDNS
jgi:hypothetical protein